jgi:hypothetical protein
MHGQTYRRGIYTIIPEKIKDKSIGLLKHGFRVTPPED